MQLKPHFRLRLQCSDAATPAPVVSGSAILSQLASPSLRRLTGCYGALEITADLREG